MSGKSKAFNSDDHALLQKAYRTGEFKELARQIVLSDREARKYRISVDTGGSIARALENAYKLGLAHGQIQEDRLASITPELSEALCWNTIPSRCRDIFDSILRNKMVVLLSENANPNPFLDRPDKWCGYCTFDNDNPSHSWSISTIDPLIRLGLLRVHVVPDGIRGLVPTDKGWDVWIDHEHAMGHYIDGIDDVDDE